MTSFMLRLTVGMSSMASRLTLMTAPARSLFIELPFPSADTTTASMPMASSSSVALRMLFSARASWIPVFSTVWYPIIWNRSV